MQDDIREILERCYNTKTTNEDNQVIYNIDEESLRNIYQILLSAKEIIEDKEKTIEEYKSLAGWLFIGIVALLGLLIGIVLF